LPTRYFAKSGPPNARSLRQILTDIVFPYFIFETIWTVLRWVLGGGFSLDYTTASWTLWFLIALALWRISLPYLVLLRFPLLIAIAISIGAGYTETIDSTLALSRTFGMLPFFVFGWKLRQWQLTGRWLDLCSGPGGKTALLAALDGGARVTAVEPAAKRADMVEQNTRGLPVEVLRVDGREPGLEPGFDRVLVDAPCTGLGALRRRPEARWRRQPADVPTLARLQRELLASAIRLTRPGGVVLYATCSPHLAETVGIVADALRRHPITALDTRPLFDPVDDLGDGPYVQLWPHRHGTDAMFAAALQVG